MAAMLPALLNQVNQMNPQPNPAPQAAGPQRFFKQFNDAHPPKFSGTEGATKLLQWFEAIENTFLHCECPVGSQVLYATSVLVSTALTWWNTKKRTLGNDAALALSWNDFKGLMMEEYCPRNELKKLGQEFDDLKQESGDHLAYTTRFQELRLLVPGKAGTEIEAIEKYIDGLPDSIQDTVTGSKPATLADAIRLAATLTDAHVKRGKLTRKGEKKPVVNPSTSDPATVTKPEPSRLNPKRKANNFAVTTPTAPTNQVAPIQDSSKRAYLGTYPQCSACQYHHNRNAPCRYCTNCQRYGHMTSTCRIGLPTNPQPNQAPQANQNRPAPNQNPLAITNGKACFECGDPNHFRNQCPQLANVNQGGARGRAFNINVNENQDNNET